MGATRLEYDEKYTRDLATNYRNYQRSATNDRDERKSFPEHIYLSLDRR